MVTAAESGTSGNDRMREALRVARMIREFNAAATNEVREPVERKVRRWQQLRTPALAPEVQTVRAYNPAWPEIFAAERARLLGVLGDEARAIEHMGSTSIPGLGSKSILDLLVAVRDMPAAVPLLVSAGYQEFGGSPCDHEAVWLWNTSAPDHGLTIHLCRYDNPWIQTALNFRDYMRAHPEECARYEELKHRLGAARTGLLEYSLGKLKLFYELSARADAWVAAGRA